MNRKQYFELDEQQRERGAQIGTNRPGQSCNALSGAIQDRLVAGKVVGNMKEKVNCQYKNICEEEDESSPRILIHQPHNNQLMPNK